MTSGLGARAGHYERIWALEVVNLGTVRVYRRRGRLGVAINAGVRAFRSRGWFMMYDIGRIMTRRTRGAHLGVVEAGTAVDGGERRRPAAEGLGSRGGR
jgi:hypothetical protein